MLVDSQRCRRCRYRRVIKLQKMRDDDHDVYRCVECGYIFSPPPDQEPNADPESPSLSPRAPDRSRGAPQGTPGAAHRMRESAL